MNRNGKVGWGNDDLQIDQRMVNYGKDKLQTRKIRNRQRVTASVVSKVVPTIKV